ncbi:XRE family transcriptional regulator [Flavobacterium sp. ST-75]|uniref:XRE family transcriptional regulator n=1 Tax=Flavobacterium rhizophilum TaxID=3163296 RepID=A0ABW8YE91_9FLAO
MNNRQLTFAREFRGYSQTELANSIKGLSQSNLSKFEKGLGYLSEDLQKKIIDFLDFPVSFFERKINSTITHAHYRKKSAVSKAEITKFENKCKLLGYIVDEMSESINWPEFNFIQLNIEEGYSPAYIAGYNRAALKIPKGAPLKDICNLLENNGVIIYEMEIPEKFDGISFFTDKGYPIVIINRNFPNDRKRFTIAHELGHLLMHNDFQFPISEYRDEKFKEKEANEFASEFLMPSSDIKNSLRGLKWNDLGVLKSYWLTSIASIIRRAKDLECISNDRFKHFRIEMSRYGYNKKEPIDVYIDKPQCFKNGYHLFKNELSYSDDDFVQTMNLPLDIIKDIFYYDRLVSLKVVRNIA